MTNPTACKRDQFEARVDAFEAKVRRILERHAESLALDNEDDREQLIALLVRKLGPR